MHNEEICIEVQKLILIYSKYLQSRILQLFYPFIIAKFYERSSEPTLSKPALMNLDKHFK